MYQVGVGEYRSVLVGVGDLCGYRIPIQCVEDQSSSELCDHVWMFVVVGVFGIVALCGGGSGEVGHELVCRSFPPRSEVPQVGEHTRESEEVFGRETILCDLCGVSVGSNHHVCR